jgi:ABC-2 type transport system ATP-binding protein
MADAVEIRNVCKSYPLDQGLGQLFHRAEERPALKNVSLTMNAGECYGLLGLNGAGKTTLLKIISTLLIPDSGSVSVLGYDVAKQAADVRRRIGICSSDERSFYMRLTAWDNMKFFGKLQGLGGKALHRRVLELAEWLGLSGRLDLTVRSYSTGMKQRLALMRAMLADPPVLLLDEPTKALDPIAAVEFREMVRDRLVVAEGKTVLLATNQLDEAWSVCDRMAILHDKRVSAEGTPLEIEAKAPAGTREQPLFGYFRHVAGAR